MILRKLVLENFGLYEGRTELDLAPRGSAGTRPVVLIGGRNGAGKTTLLEAVRLALYGKRALGVRVGQSEYDNYLCQRLSRSAKEPVAMVALEFDYAEDGKVHRYGVRRTWAVRGKTASETLTLEKDGAPVTTVPPEEWHHFLQELVPPGLSQLFFFDGEKIQDIAEGHDDEQLAEAVRGLLGIDLVTRLRTDLGLYIARHKRGDHRELADLLEANVRDLAVAERAVVALGEDLANLHSERTSQARAAEAVRHRFVAEGGDVALARARIESDLAAARSELRQLEQELREQANRLLPFTLAPRLLARVRTAVASRPLDAAQQAALIALAEDLKSWDQRAATWQDAHWSDLQRFVAARAGAGAVPERLSGDLSVEDLRERLAEVERVGRPAARSLLERFEALQARVESLSISLKRADTAAAGVMLDELMLADQKVGASDAGLRAKDEEFKTAKHRVLTLKRERSRLLESQTQQGDRARQEDLAVRAAKALAAYEAQLLALRLQQLRVQFLRCFRHLSRKPDLVSDARIDPRTFAVTLIGQDAQEFPRSALSAGEKQIYATAMLWALARTSGRQLPMIIDTPLARLDTEHRARLVDRYFPAASHQVILLSTDTEIDGPLLEQLEPMISHSYRLDFDQSTGRTEVSPGYFQPVSEEGPRELQQA
jgi:DNA sulfur modification protein DndD